MVNKVYHPSQLSLPNNTNEILRNTTTSSSEKNLKNSEQKKNQEEKNATESKVAKETITSELKKIFNGHLPFDSNFVPELLRLMKEFGINGAGIQKYLRFVLERTNEKNPNSLTNLYYKMAKSPAMAQDFIALEKKCEEETAKKNRYIELCPVCGAEANIYKKCSCCNFDMNDSLDSEKVSTERQIFTLPESLKKKFRDEFQTEIAWQLKYQLSHGFKTLPTFESRLIAIYQKYGIKSKGYESCLEKEKTGS